MSRPDSPTGCGGVGCLSLPLGWGVARRAVCRVPSLGSQGRGPRPGTRHPHWGQVGGDSHPTREQAPIPDAQPTGKRFLCPLRARARREDPQENHSHSAHTLALSFLLIAPTDPRTLTPARVSVSDTASRSCPRRPLPSPGSRSPTETGAGGPERGFGFKVGHTDAVRTCPRPSGHGLPGGSG